MLLDALAESATFIESTVSAPRKPPTKARRPHKAFRHIAAPPKHVLLATEAEGLVLELSRDSVSGYLYVAWDGTNGRFKARHPKRGYLGSYKTAVEGAVA
eukprot:3304606-Prymnesium_polylepis.1